MSFKVSKKSAVKLLEQLGYQNAAKMPVPTLYASLKKLDDTLDDKAEEGVKDEASQELLRKLRVTLTKGEEVTITSEGEAGTKDRPPEKKDEPVKKMVRDELPAKKKQDTVSEKETSKPSKKSKPSTSEPQKITAVPAAQKPTTNGTHKKVSNPDQKPQRSSDAKPGAATSKPAKRTTVTKLPRTGKNGRPGVYATIVEELQKASKAKPVTPDAIMRVLTTKLKDRAPDGMRVTLNDALRRTLSARYNLNPVETEKGGWYLEKVSA